MSGYQGSYYLGATFETEGEEHNFDVGIGMSPGIVENDVYQFNMKYVYSPFEWEPGNSGFSSNIIGVGVLTMRCLCSEVFIKNLDIYPEENYYDETAWRFGLVFEHTVRRDKFEAYLDWVLLDQIMIASWNNPGMRKYPFDYWSAGLGVRFFPEW
ncbi:hypothetical protein D3C72_1279620 [compost metagenome]